MIRVHVHLRRVVPVATTIEADSAQSQSATVGTNVSDPPSVLVTDQSGNPVSGVTVTFAVTAGGGSRSPATVNTNASGIATLTSWTLGASEGTNTLTATAAGLTGSPVTFNATGTEAGSVLTFPSLDWAYLLGPMAPLGSYVQPGTTIMEENAIERIDEFLPYLTTPAGMVDVAGTIALEHDSANVVGTGTGFTSAPFFTNTVISWPDATLPQGRRYEHIGEITDATHCKLRQYSPGGGVFSDKLHEGPTASGLTIKIHNVLSDFSGPIYYDTPYGVYQAAMRVGGGTFDAPILAKARQMSDAVAASYNYGEFTSSGLTGMAGGVPRSASLMGFFCRALDAKPEWWDKLDVYVDNMQAGWLDNKKTGGSQEGYIVAVRDCGYTLIFEATIAALLPAGARKTYFQNKAIEHALDPCIRDMVVGAWGGRWENRDNSVPGGNGRFAADGVTDVGMSQPFLDCLMTKGLIATHRMMRKNGLTADPDYDTIGDAIVTACTGYRNSYRNVLWPKVRAVPYWSGLAGEMVALDWGTLQSATSTTAVLAATANLLALTPGVVGCFINTLTGTGAGQQRTFSGWVNGTRTVTISSAWGTIPDSTTTYRVCYPLIVPASPGTPFAVFDYLAEPDWGWIQNNDRSLNPDGIANMAYAEALVGDGTFRDFALEQLASCMEFRPDQGLDRNTSLYYTPQAIKNHAQHHGIGEIQKLTGWLVGGLAGDALV